MRSAASDTSETVIPFAPVKSPIPDPIDPLDSAGHTILGLLHRAAEIAEENSQHALGVAHKIALQLRAAEDRIRELEADVRHYQHRVDRAEGWLHKISQEIDQRFFGSADDRQAQAPAKQNAFRAPAGRT